ncbi:unnamed protein product [Linum trigynum]|uniref:TF-B3 domain-containing protein n=1 Tax=Linum trigynum TaxID=586398 RepID=A0AAV2GET7_9ROSI
MLSDFKIGTRTLSFLPRHSPATKSEEAATVELTSSTMDASVSWLGSRFVRILLQEDIDQDKNMLIPKKYSDEHCYGLPSMVTLELPNGDAWLVQLVRDDKGRVWFKKGWQQFSRHYCFKHGDFLVFERQGTSRFLVLVFERSAAEIDYSKFPVDCSCPEELAPAVGRMKMGDPKGKAPATAVGFTDNAETQFRPSSSNLPNDFGISAAAPNFPTEQPFFSKVITARYSSSNGPRFPLEFVHKHITRSSVEWLQLRVGDSIWAVKLLVYDQHGYSMPCRGWMKFATDNLLNKGDICKFEVTTTPKTLNVHIQRHPS